MPTDDCLTTPPFGSICSFGSAEFYLRNGDARWQPRYVNQKTIPLNSPGKTIMTRLARGAPERAITALCTKANADQLLAYADALSTQALHVPQETDYNAVIDSSFVLRGPIPGSQTPLWECEFSLVRQP